MKTRVLMVTIHGQSDSVVRRAADLVADQVKAAATFVQATVENFADEEGRTMDDPPVLGPSIEVRNAPAHLVPPAPKVLKF